MAATAARAAREIADMSAGFEGAARVLASLSSDAAPRRTGRLAGSLRSAGGKGSATITSPLVYAIPIHWGRPAHNIAADPFIFTTARRSESQWLEPLEKDAQRIADGVEGA
jgi:hypothetical protein